MLTAAVIGCGHGGYLSIDAIQNSGEFELIAATEISPVARTKVKLAVPGAALFREFRDMLDHCDPDVVCVATPTPSHFEISCEILTRTNTLSGLLIEKPVAATTQDAAALAESVRRRQLPTVVPHGLLVLPTTQQIRTRVESGEIGKLVSIEVQNSVDLLNGGIHWVVYIISLLHNDPVELVNATFSTDQQLVNDGIHVENLGKTSLRSESGVDVVLYSGTDYKPMNSRIPIAEQKGALFRLVGSMGTIEFAAWSNLYWIGSTDNKSGHTVRVLSVEERSYHQLFLEQLAQQIHKRSTDYQSLEYSLAALRLIEQAYRTGQLATEAKSPADRRLGKVSEA